MCPMHNQPIHTKVNVCAAAHINVRTSEHKLIDSHVAAPMHTHHCVQSVCVVTTNTHWKLFMCTKQFIAGIRTLAYITVQ